MRRTFLLLVSLGLLGSVVGCGRGVCDCGLIQPLGTGTPPPYAPAAHAPAAPPAATGDGAGGCCAAGSTQAH